MKNKGLLSLLCIIYMLPLHSTTEIAQTGVSQRPRESNSTLYTLAGLTLMPAGYIMRKAVPFITAGLVAWVKKDTIILRKQVAELRQQIIKLEQSHAEHYALNRKAHAKTHADIAELHAEIKEFRKETGQNFAKSAREFLFGSSK